MSTAFKLELTVFKLEPVVSPVLNWTSGEFAAAILKTGLFRSYHHVVLHLSTFVNRDRETLLRRRHLSHKIIKCFGHNVEIISHVSKVGDTFSNGVVWV